MTGSEYERKVIEAILRDNTVYYALGLSKRHFDDRDNREIYELITSMLERKLEVTQATLSAEGVIASSSIASYQPTSAANVEYYATALRDRRRREDLAATLRDLLAQADDGFTDISEVIDSATSQILKVNCQGGSRMRKAGEVVHEALDGIERAYNAKGRIEGIDTGYADLDTLCGGFRKGELIILAARTSIGKTALALNMAQHMAGSGRRVLYFSLEMTGLQVMQRMIATESKVSHQRIRSGLLSTSDFHHLSEAAARIYEEELWIDDTPRVSFSDLRNRCRQRAVEGVDAVFVDYLTLIKYGDLKAPRYERVGELSAEMKALASELEVPVIALSQLNRSSERSDKPTLDTIRQSGEIEENADVVLILHRESRDTPESELIIAKHRNAPTGMVPLYFDLEHLRFENAVRR